MLPRVAVVDPDLLEGLPAAVIASSGLDALSQLIEPFVSARANPFSDALAREGIRRSITALPRAYRAARAGRGIAAEDREALAVASLFGGLSLPMYSLGVAHTNDFMRPDQLVGVSGALLLTNGLGAAIGPTLTSFVMEHVGVYAFPLLLATAHAAIGMFALWRMTRRRAPTAIERGPAQAIPTGSPYSTVLTQEVSATRREEAQAVRQEEPAEA